MICAKCGTELGYGALRCWRCGADTPNYTDEMKALYKEDEQERLQDLLRRNPEMAPPSRQKLVRVYKQTWFGRRLAGWIDENGSTYKNNRPFKPIWKPRWSVNEQGHIYLEAGEHRAFVGWVDSNGAVYAQYARPASGFFNYPQNQQLFRPPVSFSPDFVLQVSADGTVYRPGRRGVRAIGKVEGASNLKTVAGLALVVLL